MEYIPPIEERTDKELINAISNNIKWSKEFQDLAYAELLNRKYTITEIENKKRDRQVIIDQFRERTRQQRERNRKASYTPSEMIWVVITAMPILLVSPFRVYAFLDKYNYKRKIRQRIALTVISAYFWYWVLWLMV